MGAHWSVVMSIVALKPLSWGQGEGAGGERVVCLLAYDECWNIASNVPQRLWSLNNLMMCISPKCHHTHYAIIQPQNAITVDTNISILQKGN